VKFNFLPADIRYAILSINENKLSEIRVRSGQRVIVEYEGEYNYLGKFGITKNKFEALICESASQILLNAMGDCVYKYSEQLKQGFITIQKGIRIGIAGEFVTEGDKINTINFITSLNIRIAHDIKGCSLPIFKRIMLDRVPCILLFSIPGAGKTTYLRDIAYNLSNKANKNILIFDERDEIACVTESGPSFDLGERVDVIRGANKLYSITSAIRALKPQVIIFDEFYGKNDLDAINFAVSCNIPIIASTHICDKNYLKNLPFDYFVELTKIGANPIIYDKNFNIVCDSGINNATWNTVF